MGFRTVVVLNNDLAHEWENDPELGKKIFLSASAAQSGYGDRVPFRYGSPVEQVHADTQSLVVCDGYSGKTVAYGHWHRGQTDEDRDVALLKALADKLGYRVSKKPAQKDIL